MTSLYHDVSTTSYLILPFPEPPSNFSYFSCQKGSIHYCLRPVLFNRLHPLTAVYTWLHIPMRAQKGTSDMPASVRAHSGCCSQRCPVGNGPQSKTNVGWGGWGEGEAVLSPCVVFLSMWQRTVIRNSVKVLDCLDAASLSQNWHCVWPW